MCNTAFAILAGGPGSPPHLDSMFSVRTRMRELNTAVGYVIQGCKYVWATSPIGDQVHTFAEFFDQETPWNEDRHAKEFRRAIRDREVPKAFQGVHSLGWPTVEQWTRYGANGNCNHFHVMLPGDVYIVIDGVWHCVINHHVFIPVGVAHDDEWVASNGTYHSYLRPQ